MKVIVLGAGVIGVTTAWYLAERGFDVHVIDRQAGPALETSFANAGQISPGYSTPWAMPSLPIKAMRWLVQKHSPLVIRPQALSPSMIDFIARLLGNCTAHAYDVNKGRMLRIADYSRNCMSQLREETHLAFDEQQKGLIQLFRNQKQLDHAQEDMRLLEASGITYELLTPSAIIEYEPGLSRARHRLTGGLRLPGDESGDAYLFTTHLAERAAEKGVTFHFNTHVEGLDAMSDSIYGVRTQTSRLTADAYVLALGSYSTKFLSPLGLHLPVYPVKGYSLTAPLTDEAHAPRSTVNDETYKVAITRLGNRIRIGGTAELTGWKLKLSRDRRETLERSFSELFGGADLQSAQYWTGLRPCTPDGTPVVGPSGKFKNLWLNTGHGTLGWTMAAGSARVLSDQIADRTPEIPALDLAITRYA